MLKLKLSENERVVILLPSGDVVSLQIEGGRDGGKYVVRFDAPRDVRIERESRLAQGGAGDVLGQ